MRPILRPGLQVLRRDANTVQLGLDWPGVCTLSVTPALTAVLEAVDGFRDSSGVVLAAVETGASRADAQSALDVLIDCGALVDQATVWRRDDSEGAWAALWLLAGPERGATEVVCGRQGQRVQVRGTGYVGDAVRSVLSLAGVTAVPQGAANLLVLASDSEPSRDVADDVMREGVAHVWVYTREVVGVIGPFVVPGRSGCLRCADLARSELDPAWPTLLESAAARPLPTPACDPLLAALLGAWAAQEVAVWASGLRPQTWDCVIEIPQGFGSVSSQAFGMHPRCGCGWPVWQDTMGA